MKFGLFYELSVPRPWHRDAEHTVYHNALEQVKLADELGFDQVWAVEHHFLEEYSHCSAPELFLTACAMLTKRIQVGHGILAAHLVSAREAYPSKSYKSLGLLP
jgi:alkanesulfonate monooxygenase SsuD/methylene tetrahydromethanopterin reductase-like flavin-dependent oxidoreductase (luciferase family)